MENDSKLLRLEIAWDGNRADGAEEMARHMFVKKYRPATIASWPHAKIDAGDDFTAALWAIAGRCHNGRSKTPLQLTAVAGTLFARTADRKGALGKGRRW